MSKNFPATRDGIAIAATAAATTTQLGTDTSLALAAVDALVDNRGDYDAYIKFVKAGGSVTKATGLRIPAGSIGIYGKSDATHIAVIGDGSTSLVVHLGEGV